MENLKNSKRIVLILIDMVLINLSFLFAFYLRFTKNIPYKHIISFKNSFIAITLIYLISLSIFKLYKSLWHYASIDEFLLGIGGCVTGSILCFLYGKLVGPRLPYSVYALAGILSMVLIIGFRISFRAYRRFLFRLKHIHKSKFQNVLVIGAGQAGNMIIKEMRLHSEVNYMPLFVIDDKKSKIGCSISGVKVYGDRSKIAEVTELYNIDVIILAIPSIDNKNKEEIINICKKTKCKLKIVPGIYELLSEETSLNQIRDVEVEDLLGREPIKLDMKGISNYLEDRVVLVTGGGGSIGSELARQITKFNAKKLIILDIYENNAYEIQNELKHSAPDLDLKIIIASVRDKQRMEKIFQEYRPDIVFHAAAHKHVPLMEENPYEAVKNNVFGTLNVAECANKYGVEKFVLISTDKAVNPTNVMGTTKRICEMIIQGINQISKTEFVAVRFGNVLGSNGSVIPLFKKQITQGGPITLTHREITRFFMTIPEAAQLVLQAGAYAKGGEIFILDMGKPVKIYDLACDLIRLSGLEPHKDIRICYTGLRPGEKLYEEVLMEEESLKATAHDKIFIGKPLNIQYSLLKRELSELSGTIDKSDTQELVKKLRKLVPTYKCQILDQVVITKDFNESAG